MAAPEAAGISWRDSVLFALLVLRRYRFRTSMMLLAMTLAVGSVVAFTALGEGARGFAGSAARTQTDNRRCAACDGNGSA